MEIVFTDYAYYEMQRRQIREEMACQVIQQPGQILEAKENRKIYQSRYRDIGLDRQMLLRVIVEERAGICKVVTAYKTSKIEKYWRPS